MALGDATVAQPNTQLGTDIGSIISLITGLTGSGKANTIAQTADPWGPQRPQYQTALNSFMANPASIFTDPSFQAAENVGAENIARYAGAAGMGNSGNKLADLFKFGQSSGLDFEKQRFNELADLAGVNAGSPVAAAGLQLGNLQTQGSNFATGLAGVLPMILQALGLGGGGGGLGSLIGNLFGGGGGGGFNLTPGIDFNPDLGTSVPDPGSFQVDVPGIDNPIDIGGLFGP